MASKDLVRNGFRFNISVGTGLTGEKEVCIMSVGTSRGTLVVRSRILATATLKTPATICGFVLSRVLLM